MVYYQMFPHCVSTAHSYLVYPAWQAGMHFLLSVFLFSGFLALRLVFIFDFNLWLFRHMLVVFYNVVKWQLFSNGIAIFKWFHIAVYLEYFYNFLFSLNICIYICTCIRWYLRIRDKNTVFVTNICHQSIQFGLRSQKTLHS